MVYVVAVSLSPSASLFLSLSRLCVAVTNESVQHRLARQFILFIMSSFENKLLCPGVTKQRRTTETNLHRRDITHVAHTQKLNTNEESDVKHEYTHFTHTQKYKDYI